MAANYERWKAPGPDAQILLLRSGETREQALVRSKDRELLRRCGYKFNTAGNFKPYPGCERDPDDLLLATSTYERAYDRAYKEATYEAGFVRSIGIEKALVLDSLGRLGRPDEARRLRTAWARKVGYE